MTNLVLTVSMLVSIGSDMSLVSLFVDNNMLQQKSVVHATHKITLFIFECESEHQKNKENNVVPCACAKGVIK